MEPLVVAKLYDVPLLFESIQNDSDRRAIVRLVTLCCSPAADSGESKWPLIIRQLQQQIRPVGQCRILQYAERTVHAGFGAIGRALEVGVVELLDCGDAIIYL